MCSKVLPCPLCSKPNFESIDALKISLVKVTNRPLSCPICNEIQIGLDKLTIHLFSHSLAMDLDEQGRNSLEISRPESFAMATPQSPSSSSSPSINPSTLPRSPSTKKRTQKYLDQPSPSSSTTTLSGTNSMGNVKCDICDFIFENQKHLSMHMHLVHVGPNTGDPSMNSDNPLKFPCHLCNKSFKMKGSLRVHLRVVHMHGFANICKNAGKNKDDDEQQNDNGLLIENVENFPSGNSHNALVTGMGISNCTVDQSSLNGGQLIIVNEQKTSPDQSKSWVCDICTKTFTTKYFLKKHKRLHTGEMPYACAICAKTFTFQQSYHKHLLYHSDEKPHVCGTCGRAFKELSTLHNHERIHSGEKPFSCETCGKCFRQRVSYLVHRRIHTGSMPYKCTACAKSFRYKVSQRTHKCPAQPPGQVVRQSGELLQKLLLNSNWISEQEETNHQEDMDLKNSEAEERNRIDELIDKSIEDMVRGKVDHINELFPTPIVEEILGIPPQHDQQHESANSPSDQFQNLCLYSHDHSLDTLNEESFKDLLYTGIN